jgi:glutaredoxin
MKYLVILLVLLGFYQYVYKPSTVAIPSDIKVSSTGHYVAVYGRDSCSVTKQTLSYMAKNSIEYTYLNIDDKEIESSLHEQMQSQGISTRRYNLPVVDFSGELTVRPNKTKILDGSNG